MDIAIVFFNFITLKLKKQKKKKNFLNLNDNYKTYKWKC